MGSVALSKDDEVQVEENRENDNFMGNGEESGIAGQDGNHTSKWVKIFEEVAEKSGSVLKTSAFKVGDFTAHATHLAKLKLEAHKLNNELCKLILETGHKLWELHKDHNLDQVEDIFSEDFKEIASIEEKLQENQKQMQH